MIELLLFCIIWFAFGVFSFIHWWTRDFDFKSADIPVAILVGFLGPISFLIGSAIHGNKSNKVWISKR